MARKTVYVVFNEAKDDCSFDFSPPDLFIFHDHPTNLTFESYRPFVLESALNVDDVTRLVRLSGSHSEELFRVI